MFLGLEQGQLLTELQRERNNEIITNFASDYSLRFVIMQKVTEKEVKLEVEWSGDMLTTTNILIIKRNNFSLYKDIAHIYQNINSMEPDEVFYWIERAWGEMAHL